MSITDHVAIFLMGALDQPKAGKAKPNSPTYWGQFAFPPSAKDDLLAACVAAAPNGSLNGLNLPVKTHSKFAADKKFPGIPDDWYIARMATGPDYPPELFLADGRKINALPINGGEIRGDFYSGQRVRVNTYAFHYPPKNGGSAGVSFNLSGVMSEGGGERRPGGNGGESSESAFAKYRQSGSEATPAQSQAARSSTPATGGATGNPFVQERANDPFQDDDIPF